MQAFNFGSPAQPPPSESPTLFKILTTIAIPIAAMVIAALLQKNKTVFWAVLGFGLISLLFGSYPLIRPKYDTAVRRRRARRIVRERYSEFRKYVLRFGDFVDNRTSDTLHFICQSDICGSVTTGMDSLHTAPAEVFAVSWSYLNDRTQSLPDVTAFKSAVRELNSLVALYSTHCVRPIFECFPAALRPALTDHVKAKLEDFRERFVGFQERYFEFLKELDAALTGDSTLIQYFYRPKRMT